MFLLLIVSDVLHNCWALWGQTLYILLFIWHWVWKCCLKVDVGTECISTQDHLVQHHLHKIWKAIRRNSSMFCSTCCYPEIKCICSWWMLNGKEQYPQGSVSPLVTVESSIRGSPLDLLCLCSAIYSVVKSSIIKQKKKLIDFLQGYPATPTSVSATELYSCLANLMSTQLLYRLLAWLGVLIYVCQTVSDMNCRVTETIKPH